MRLRAILAAAWLFAGATLATAQTPGVMQHPLIPSNLIDGSKNPEQIPDTVAFQLWLHHHYSEPTLAMPRLPAADLAVLKAAVASYGQQFPSIQSALQSAITADIANGTNAASPDAFWSGHYTLTNGLWANLQANMTPVGFARFGIYLQGQRNGMQVSPYNYGMPNSATLIKEASMVASASMAGMAMPTGTNMIPNYSSYFTMNPIVASGGDNFANDANGAQGTQWTGQLGAFQVVNGYLTVTRAPAMMYYNQTAYAPSPDQTVNIFLGTPPANGGYAGVYARGSASGTTRYSMYFFNNPSQGIVLYRYVNGVNHLLGTFYTTLHSGDRAALTLVGSSLRVNYFPSSGTVTNPVISVTDTAITSGYFGIDVSSGTTATFSAFAGTDDGGVQVSGEVSGTTICNGGGACPAAVHTPQVTNQITPHGGGTIGGTVYGQGVPPANYASASNSQSFTAEQIGGYGVAVFDDEVVCSIVGALFQGNGTGNDAFPIYEIAATLSQNMSLDDVPSTWILVYDFGGGVKWYGYKLAPVCIFTPDFNPNAFDNPEFPLPPKYDWYPFYHVESWCERPSGSPVGTKWACLGDNTLQGPEEPPDLLPWLPVSSSELTQNPPKYLITYGNGSGCYCTNWDNAINVWDGPPSLPGITLIPFIP